MFDDLVMGPQTAELMRRGYLARYRLFGPPPAGKINADDMKHQGGDFAKADASAASMKPAIMGSVMGHYRLHLNGAPSVAFTASIAAAESYAEKFRAEGWRAASIDGKIDKTTRRQVTTDFARGQLNVLCSCDIISEGYDVPGIVGGIFLRPTESLGLNLQQMGRTFRTSPGKDCAILLDHVGNTHRHGLPDDERQWTLDAESRAKRKKRDPDDVAIRQCKKCYAINQITASKCKECGEVFVSAARVIEERDGDLYEINGETFRMSRAEVLAAAAEQVKPSELEALTTIGKMKGMNNPEGWARHVLEARIAKRAKSKAAAA
jgi:superfamily II DNA or RNA helicase